jgi:hypothetical protein
MTARTAIRLLLVSGMLAASSARAATVICSGSITQLSYHQPGYLLLQLSSMNVPVLICSVDQEWVVPGTASGNTSPAACRAIYASLLAAKTSGTHIRSLYLDGSDVPASCNSFSNWTRVNVRYFEH